MENPKRLIPLRGRAALLATACLLSPLFAGEASSPSGMAQRELAKRAAAVEEAQELLLKGDESYKAQRYSDAVAAYEGARDLIPETPVSSELRKSATDRYAQASVQYGRELARKGDVKGAKDAVDKVLIQGVAPEDPAALSFRTELDDPIRTNPAADAAFAKNVDQVRKLLYTAEGDYNLGKYDEAKTRYEDVLRIDHFNTAARRGLERVASAKSGYQKSAYDQTRAELLADVEGAMTPPLDPLPLNPQLPGTATTQAAPDFIPIGNKLQRINIPKVNLEQSSLTEAIDFLRLKVAELEPTNGLGGVNFTIDLGDSARTAEVNAQRFDLRLNSTPLSQVLKYITDVTRTSFTTDDYSVIIRPLGAGSTEMISHIYKVPPDFISSISGNAASSAGAAPPDPFASAAATGTGAVLAKRLTAQEALGQQGVTFPPGAIASLANNVLRVTNTAANQDIISQIIDTTVQTEPVMIAVRVTMIRTEQHNLEELGFDWLLDGINMGELNVAGGTQGNGGDLSDARPGSSSANPNRPITAGNRSGQEAVTGNTIDDLIASRGDRTPQIAERAPGILQVTGLIKGDQVNMLMRGLSQKKGVDLMTQPSTITRSGQASSIHVVREFIYPTEYEPPKLPQTISSTEVYLNGVFVGSLGGNSFPVTPATPKDFKERDTGVILEVLPTVDSTKQYVDITLNPSVTDFDGFVNYGSPISMPGSNGNTTVITPNEILMPVFSTQRANTTLTVADGATIVIGGLLSESVQNVEDKTPVLGDLPVVGRLFQSKVKAPVSTAIVFLVNVQLLDPTGRPYHAR